MKRYLAVLFVIILLSLGLSGCARQDTSVSAPAASTPAPAPTPTPIPTVTLPDGREFNIFVTSLDLSSVPGSAMAETAEVLKALPELCELQLGNADERMSAEELAAFMAEFPDVNIDGCFTLLGQRRDLNEQIELDLSELGSEQVPELAAELSVFRNVKRLDMGSDKLNDLSFEDVAMLESAAPNAEYSYDFSMYDRDFSVNTKKINLSHVHIYDEGETVRRALRCMPLCDYLDMDSCGVSDESMAAIRDEFPQVEVIWRVFFGYMYSVRTNTEVIMASDAYNDGELTDENAVSMKYCTKVKYLDIGHNAKLTDLSFLYDMPDIEVLITCGSVVLEDLTPIASLKKLEYLELITATKLSDLSPLAELTELEHLNICNCPEIEDISPLFGLTKLKRLWIGCLTDKVTAEQVEEMQRCVPECIINTTVYDPTDDPKDVGWRYTRVDSVLGNIYHPRYELLRKQFNYSNAPYCYSFTMYDPYAYQPAPTPED